MNIHESQLFWGSLGTRVLTHPHKIPAFLLGRLAINRYFSSGFTYIYMELSFNIGIWDLVDLTRENGDGMGMEWGWNGDGMGMEWG